MEESRAAQLERVVAELERRLEELSARLPAHSLPASMQAELDDLDSQLAVARQELAAALRRQGQAGT